MKEVSFEMVHKNGRVKLGNETEKSFRQGIGLWLQKRASLGEESLSQSPSIGFVSSLLF